MLRETTVRSPKLVGLNGRVAMSPSRGFRALAVAAAFSAWALVAVGGVVRVTASGLGCPHWPLCTDRAVPLSTRASAIEYSHRAVVALVIALVVWLWVWAWRRVRERSDVFWSASAAVVLVPLQALLGAVAVWLDLPGWIVAVHFVVGMVFLASVVAVAAFANRGAVGEATPGFARLAWGTAVLGLVLVSVGATVVAVGADTACGKQWPACNGGFATGGGHAGLQVAHRMLAYSIAVLAVLLFVQAWRRRGPRVAGMLPLGAVLAQIGFGIGIVLVGGSGRAYEILSGLHVAGAGLVLATLVSLAVVVSPPFRVTASRGEPSRATVSGGLPA
jgi:heme a synthase